MPLKPDTRRTSRPTAMPEVTDENFMEVLRAIRDVLMAREGETGDPLDRAVTFRHLYERGFLPRSALDGTVLARLPGLDVVSFLVPPAARDAPDFAQPPTPSNLAATAGVKTITLSWDAAQYHNHGYTEIWRATSSDLATAALIGWTIAAVFADALGTAVTRHYWIRHVSAAKIPGPFSASANATST